MKILNLYAGIGGNRKLWKGHDVTAVECDADIAAVYKQLFPNDKVIITDAHDYLLEHFTEFDFIWSSPPCPTHSRMVTSFKGENRKHLLKYPDMIIFAKDKDGTPIKCENCGICLSSVSIVLADDKQYKRAERLFNKILQDSGEYLYCLQLVGEK